MALREGTRGLHWEIHKWIGLLTILRWPNSAVQGPGNTTTTLSSCGGWNG